ncbi:DUF4126 domain-containing protein [Egicoccus sp. AB-alg6-2]|uniref:DUF4126 domain-containing protein n=1 Tax=Egicoccus sp. AB-alg6-2 TaxID=3242692 RepID=UPI00359E1748
MEGLAGLVAGVGYASGLNLYAVVALLGLFGRYGVADVPEVFLRTDVLTIAGLLFLVEFVVDKIPYVDDLWDVVHTAIRPLGAVGVAWLLTGDATAWEQVGSAAAAGGLATMSHLAKATTRAAVNTSPEPFTNSAISLGEDGIVAGVVWLAVTNPVAALVVVAVLLVVGTVVALLLVRTARRSWRRWRERRREGSSAPRP